MADLSDSIGYRLTRAVIDSLVRLLIPLIRKYRILSHAVLLLSFTCILHAETGLMPGRPFEEAVGKPLRGLIPVPRTGAGSEALVGAGYVGEELAHYAFDGNCVDSSLNGHNLACASAGGFASAPQYGLKFTDRRNYVDMSSYPDLLGGGVTATVCGQWSTINPTAYAQALLSITYDAVGNNATASTFYGFFSRGAYIGVASAGAGAANEPGIAGRATLAPYSAPDDVPICLAYYIDATTADNNAIYSGQSEAPSYSIKQTLPKTTPHQLTLGNLRSDGLANSYTSLGTYYLLHLCRGCNSSSQIKANLLQAKKELASRSIFIKDGFSGARNKAPLFFAVGSSLSVGYNSSFSKLYQIGSTGFIVKQLEIAHGTKTLGTAWGLPVNFVVGAVGGAAYRSGTAASVLTTQLPEIPAMKSFYGTNACVVQMDGPTNDLVRNRDTTSDAWAWYQQAADTAHSYGCHVIGTTVAPRADCTDVAPFAGCETRRAALNRLIRSGWRQHFDALIDLDADPRLQYPHPAYEGVWMSSKAYAVNTSFTCTTSACGAANNGQKFTVQRAYTSGSSFGSEDAGNVIQNMYSDGVHLSDAGYVVWGSRLLDILNSPKFVSWMSAP